MRAVFLVLLAVVSATWLWFVDAYDAWVHTNLSGWQTHAAMIGLNAVILLR